MASYYPRGGWDDFVEDFDTLEEARVAAKKADSPYGRTDIVDSEIKEVIE